MRLRAGAGLHATSLDIDLIGFASEDFQFAALGFGLSSEDVVHVAGTDFLLSEGLGRNWASQRGGGG